MTSTPALMEALALAARRASAWKVELPYAAPGHGRPQPDDHALTLDGGDFLFMVGANGLGIPVMRALQSVNAHAGAHRIRLRHHRRSHRVGPHAAAQGGVAMVAVVF